MDEMIIRFIRKGKRMQIVKVKPENRKNEVGGLMDFKIL